MSTEASPSTSHAQGVQTVISDRGEKGFEARGQMVAEFHLFEVIHFYPLNELLVDFCQRFCCKIKAKTIGNKGNDLEHLSLIVDDWALGIRVVKCRKLLPTNRVSGGDETAIKQVPAACLYKIHSDEHHDRIENSQVSLNGEVAISVNVHKLLKKLASRDADIIQNKISVGLAAVSDLCANVSIFYPRQRKMSF